MKKLTFQPRHFCGRNSGPLFTFLILSLRHFIMVGRANCGCKLALGVCGQALHMHFPWLQNLHISISGQNSVSYSPYLAECCVTAESAFSVSNWASALSGFSQLPGSSHIMRELCWRRLLV